MAPNMALQMAPHNEDIPALRGDPCPKCGGPQKIIGFMPHGQFEKQFRLELYRCLQCNAKSERLVAAE
jgi:hypothetical protein